MEDSSRILAMGGSVMLERGVGVGLRNFDPRNCGLLEVGLEVDEIDDYVHCITSLIHMRLCKLQGLDREGQCGIRIWRLPTNAHCGLHHCDLRENFVNASNQN